MLLIVAALSFTGPTLGGAAAHSSTEACEDFGWVFASAGSGVGWKVVCARPRNELCRTIPGMHGAPWVECLADGRRPRVWGFISAKLTPVDPSAMTRLDSLRAEAGFVPGEIVSASEPHPVREGLFDGFAWRATVKVNSVQSGTERVPSKGEALFVLLVGQLGELTVGITATVPRSASPIEIEDATRLISSFDMRQGSFTIPGRP